MAREQELKLAIAESSWDTVVGYLDAQGAQRSPCDPLVNTYFDTPDGQLNQQRIALRIRQSREGYVQTLKTKGTATQGLHDRQEWDWPLRSGELDRSLLARSPIADSVELDRLQPVFSTDFKRDAWLWRDGDQAIEFALDRGLVTASAATAARATTATTAISEVELELKDGDTACLLAQANKLSQICPVFLNPVSKAEQGYYLGGLYQPEAGEVDPSASPAETLDAWFQALGYFSLTGQAAFLAQAQTALQQLATAATAGSTGAAASPLNDTQWAQLLQLQTGFIPGTPAQARAQLLESPLLGQCQLQWVITSARDT